jgi:5,10-methylenetetrahydrofolate reductase
MDDVQLEPTAFCIGTAGYPEKHFEAMNMTTDLQYLKDKVDAGAEYIVTQMFFDNQKFFDFVAACRAIGITVPIIPGLKPIKTMDHITFLPKFFKIDFPEALSRELLKCKDNKQIEQFQEDTNSKQQYIKQLEEMLPNSKRKKLGLPPIIEDETVEDTKVVAIKEVKTPEKTPVKNDVMLKEVANGGTF